MRRLVDIAEFIPARPRPSKRWTLASSRKQSGEMLAIDANVVVRFLTQDEPDQSAKANALLR